MGGFVQSSSKTGCKTECTGLNFLLETLCAAHRHCRTRFSPCTHLVNRCISQSQLGPHTGTENSKKIELLLVVGFPLCRTGFVAICRHLPAPVMLTLPAFIASTLTTINPLTGTIFYQMYSCCNCHIVQL